MEGEYAALTKHKIAGNVVEDVFNEYATPQQRERIIQEFFGPEFRRFKEDGVKSVSQLLSLKPEKKSAVMKHLGENVSILVQKGCFNHSLVHTLINEYLQNVEDAKRRADLIESLRDAVVHVLHSADGAKLSMYCFWHGTAKDRKAILKTFKTFVPKICADEKGHVVLMAAFDAVDDTKAVAKLVLNELLANLKDVAGSESGRKVLMHLMAPRDSTHCQPDVKRVLEAGDANANSKKEPEIRRAELKKVVSKPLGVFLLETFPETMFDTAWIRLRQCYLLNANAEDAKTLVEVIAEEAAKPFVAGEGQNLVEDAGSHMMLKKLIKADKERDGDYFSEALLAALDEDGVESWVTCNRGAFLFVCMLETEIASVGEKVKSKVAAMAKTLKKQKTKGAEILCKRIY